MSLDGIDFYVNIMGINLYFTDDNWKGKGMFLIRTKNIICYQRGQIKEENVNEIKQIHYSNENPKEEKINC